MKKTQRKDCLKATEWLIKAIKKADRVEVSYENEIESTFNQNTGLEESEFNGEQVFECRLYTAKLDGRSTLYARCSKVIE